MICTDDARRVWCAPGVCSWRVLSSFVSVSCACVVRSIGYRSYTVAWRGGHRHRPRDALSLHVPSCRPRCCTHDGRGCVHAPPVTPRSALERQRIHTASSWHRGRAPSCAVGEVCATVPVWGRDRRPTSRPPPPGPLRGFRRSLSFHGPCGTALVPAGRNAGPGERGVRRRMRSYTLTQPKLCWTFVP